MIHSQHNDVSAEPVFAFGHGLSYTTFEYGDIKLSQNDFKSGGSIKVNVEVSNTGDRAGVEVVQLYIRDLVGSITRPVLELKGFEKISLEPNETKTVSFEISEKTIEFYTINKKWEAEPGKFKLFIGSSSKDLKSVDFSFIN